VRIFFLTESGLVSHTSLMNVTIDTERRVSVNDNVDLLIRKVSITEAGDSPKTIEAVELREWLKNAEVEGHGDSRLPIS
jgi:hypothetical protein